MTRVALLLAGLLGLSATTLTSCAEAQGRGDAQSQALLNAATLESRGDLDGAEETLRRMLADDPTWTGALFALERVLRAKGEEAELRPLLDAFLAQRDDPQVHALKLAMLARADSTDAMVAEAERWLSSERDAEGWALAAEVYADALGPDEAVELLRRGRSRLGGDALALELGDALAAAGDSEAAAAEWARGVVDEGPTLEAVANRLRRLGGDAPEAARRLVREVARRDAPEQQRLALRVALEFALDDEATRLAARQAESLRGRARQNHLAEVGRLAREHRRHEVAEWAYAQLGMSAATVDQRREVDRSMVDAALEAGDTARALDAQRRLAATLPAGSDEARRAEAEVIRLQAAVEPEEVAGAWASFRASHPDAPELDAVAAAVAAGLQSRGDVQGAAATLQEVDGPRSAVERAFLALEQGDVEGARTLLLDAAGGLPPSEATHLIQLAGLLRRVVEPALGALVQAEVAAHRGRGAEAAASLAEAARGVDAPTLLAEAARLADRASEPELASDIRRRLVTEYPEAPEFGEAALALARAIREAGGDTEEAVRLLEDLITTDPDAAVVPEARLELERLRSRG